MRRKYQITRKRVQLHNRLEALLEKASYRCADGWAGWVSGTEFATGW
jgi:hypothetical protein